MTTQTTAEAANASCITDNDDNDDKQATTKKAQTPKNAKLRRHLRNWWKVYLVGTVLFLAILLPIL